VPLAELRPWHYSDPFFQEAPRTGAADLDGLFASQDLLALATRTFDGIGLEVRGVLARSDLFERDNKDQHAFCTHIDRLSDDVRVLCNLRPDARWMDTLLHELGHAVYDTYLGADLPYLLRTAAHINTTEAIAMLMGRLAINPEWLARVRGLDEATVRGVAAAARDEQRVAQLVFLRWGLVMVHFERALYVLKAELKPEDVEPLPDGAAPRRARRARLGREDSPGDCAGVLPQLHSGRADGQPA
jgi:peptidyl-dipeptidase A